MVEIVAMPKKRGRPRKNPMGETAQGTGQPISSTAKVTDPELLKLILDRFNVLRKLAAGSVNGKVRSMVVSGAPGIGKTYTVEKILEQAALTKGVKYKITRGYMTPVNLYKVLYQYREEGNILCIDDCDAIFYNDDGLNLLKAALDTIEHRTISWMAESAALEGIPNEFEYKGSMIFISNIDFHAFLAAGKNRVTPHLAALMNRSFYLDLKLHGDRAVSLWLNYMCRQAKMLTQHYGMNEEQAEAILDYLLKNKAEIKLLSLRSAVKCAELVEMDPENWRTMADILMK